MILVMHSKEMWGYEGMKYKGIRLAAVSVPSLRDPRDQMGDLSPN